MGIDKQALGSRVIAQGPDASAPPAAMSQAVRFGDVIMLAGMVAYDESGTLIGAGDARAQAEQCFRNIDRYLTDAGSSLDDLVEVTCYLADLSHFEDYLAVRTAVFSNQHPPATTTVVATLGRPELLVEVKAVAAIGSWRT